MPHFTDYRKPEKVPTRDIIFSSSYLTNDILLHNITYGKDGSDNGAVGVSDTKGHMRFSTAKATAENDRFTRNTVGTSPIITKSMPGISVATQ